MRGMTSSLHKTCELHSRKDPSKRRQRQYAVSRNSFKRYRLTIFPIIALCTTLNFQKVVHVCGKPLVFVPESSFRGPKSLPFLRVNKSCGGNSIFLQRIFRRVGVKEQAKASDSENKPYECSETNFDSQEDLALHMNVYNHRTVPSELDHLSL